MKKKQINKLAKKAGFCVWANETYGDGKGNIDWSCNYDKELQKFAKLVRQETIREINCRTPWN